MEETVKANTKATVSLSKFKEMSYEILNNFMRQAKTNQKLEFVKEVSNLQGEVFAVQYGSSRIPFGEFGRIKDGHGRSLYETVTGSVKKEDDMIKYPQAITLKSTEAVKGQFLLTGYKEYENLQANFEGADAATIRQTSAAIRQSGLKDHVSNDPTNQDYLRLNAVATW